jgi:hypothetical protein
LTEPELAKVSIAAKQLDITGRRRIRYSFPSRFVHVFPAQEQKSDDLNGHEEPISVQAIRSDWFN